MKSGFLRSRTFFWGRRCLEAVFFKERFSVNRDRLHAFICLSMFGVGRWKFDVRLLPAAPQPVAPHLDLLRLK
jgi:hypothetical protein